MRRVPLVSALVVALLALGRYSDALISVGLGLVNAVISAAQEIRAKRKLDRLQLLDRAPVLVNLARFVIPAAVITAGFGTAVYALLYEGVLQGFSTGRTPAQVISEFESYTGLTYTDTEFSTAAATIGGQTGLSTFVCFASFALILFLAPPTRFFAAWTKPTGDRRPAVLVAVLVAAFVAVLFVPALWSYFGLTSPARPVFTTVLPALVLWFAALSAAYRFHVLDRVLGLSELPGSGGR